MISASIPWLDTVTVLSFLAVETAIRMVPSLVGSVQAAMLGWKLQLLFCGLTVWVCDGRWRRLQQVIALIFRGLLQSQVVKVVGRRVHTAAACTQIILNASCTGRAQGWARGQCITRRWGRHCWIMWVILHPAVKPCVLEIPRRQMWAEKYTKKLNP